MLSNNTKQLNGSDVVHLEKRMKKLKEGCALNNKICGASIGILAFTVLGVVGSVLAKKMDNVYEELSSISDKQISLYSQKTGDIITRGNDNITITDVSGELKCKSNNIYLNPLKLGQNSVHIFGSGYSNLMGDCNQKFNQILNIGNTDINNDSVAEGYGTNKNTNDKI